MSNLANAQAAISELKRAFHDGLVRVGLSPAEAGGVASAGALAVFSDWFLSDSQKAAIKNMKDLQPRIADWETRRFGWAQAGKRQDGSAYSFERWFSEGKDLGSVITVHTSESVNGSAFRAVVDAAKATVGDVGAVAARAGNVLEQVGLNAHWIALGLGGLGAAYVVFRLLPRKGAA